MATTDKPAAGSAKRGSVVGGRFRIESKLAEGSMGTVFRVVDERDGRVLALKQLKTRDGTELDPRAAMQFEREYHTLTQLAHPSIIEVYDYGVDASGPYYTMELLDGADVQHQGQLSPVVACTLLRDIASSLAILHSRRLLHRDVSSRNVYRTASGRAKLIDFGAMIPMGVAQDLVGTAPFVAPEALQLQALDGRSDLYALGVLAYFVLTGRYPYPARSFAQLRDAWSSAPKSPRELVPELSEALDQLVMDLLQLDRGARPNAAAAVMERLAGIAGLPRAELPEVAQAYLVTPTLIGREAEQSRIQAALDAAAQGRGGTLLIEGDVGSGRSRLLDAVVLEAKLRGACVVRGERVGDSSEPFGFARVLCRQLIQSLPVIAFKAAQPQRAVLTHVIGNLSPRRDTLPANMPERRILQVALRDWILQISRAQLLVIAVDDLERIDEPSAALLGILAHGAGRRQLLLALTAQSGAAPNAATTLIRELAQCLQVRPLAPDQIESLLRSLFGDAPNLAALSQRTAQLSEGKPRWIMTLCEHWLRRGVIRYEAGNWMLPAEIRAEHLPESLLDALGSRVQALDPDARALGERLALTDPAALRFEQMARLTEHDDHGRTFRALQALVAAGALTVEGDCYRFSQQEWAKALQIGIDEQRKMQLHAHIARALEGSGQLALWHHMLLGGREREAVAGLLEHQADWHMSHATQVLPLLERALSAAQRLALPQRTQFKLISTLLPLASVRGDLAFYAQYGEALRTRLERDSGLADYRELPDSLDPRERLDEALRRATQRHEQASEEERGAPPAQAANQLAALCVSSASMASIAQDLALLESLPSLEPLARVSASARAAQTLLEIQRDMQSGRHGAARDKATQLIERLEQPDHAGLRAESANSMRLGQTYMLGLFAATSGHPRARSYVLELEQIPIYRVHAWRAHMVSELMHGNVEAAHACRRRSELLNLQDGGRVEFPGSTDRVELLAHMYADDLVGVKHSIERIEPMAARYPGWRPTLAIARSHYHRLQGDPKQALETLQPALDMVAPGRHVDWWLTAYSHLQILDALGEHAQASELGVRHIATWDEISGGSLDYGLRQVTAQALLGAGRLEQALALIEEYLEMHSRVGTRGLRIGLAYETRAWIAIAACDDDAFNRYARLCALEYGQGRDSTQLARYARLLQEADARGITSSRRGLVAASLTGNETVQSVRARILDGLGAEERSVTALQILVEASGASGGHLFAVYDGKLQLLASSVAATPSSALLDSLGAYVKHEWDAENAATGADDTDSTANLTRWTDSGGHNFEPLTLLAVREGKRAVVAVAALYYEGDERRTARRAVLEGLAEALAATPGFNPAEPA